AEFRQTIIKRMNGNKLEEFAQEYFVNCTLCGIIITTNLDHEYDEAHLVAVELLNPIKNPQT
ncbi:4186_t:CDS:2, partial [Funneliformis geosporum]